MKHISGKSVNRILLFVMRDMRDIAKDYTYIILGRSGKTGKTWLCNELRAHGLNAFEISEDICDFVQYKDGENHLLVNDYDKQVTIILNRSI
jgi:nicotinamide riboside kinase